ncbi:MAG: hypothetical protein K0B08_11035 [Bacteroidales bacterium]|nr:hypothetical protein [Bacteroidales bacterium]
MLKRLPDILWLTIFAIAMGYLESAVVVYLREIYYPEGFGFPLKMMDGRLALTEVVREAATLVMLAILGIIAGRTRLEKLGIFIFTFGVWDIFYYFFLKMLLGWPESLMTWDILFLIPVTWVGPVLAPLITAFTMVILGGGIIMYSDKGKQLTIHPLEWTLLIIGSLVIIFSFTKDYLRFMQQHMPLTDLFRLTKSNGVLDVTSSYVPEYFNWWIFGLGQMILFTTVILFFRRARR